MKRYKVTLSSNTVYKEIELASDLQQVKVGTVIFVCEKNYFSVKLNLLL